MSYRVSSWLIRVCFIASIAAAIVVLIGGQSVRAAETVPGHNTLVNGVDANGEGGGLGGAQLGISADGNLVLYSMTVNGHIALFQRNMTNSITTRVDVSQSGVDANDSIDTDMVAMSENGRYVVFVSEATNLLDNETSSAGRYYMRDMQLGTIRYLPLHRAVFLPQDNPSRDKVDGVSNDGRYVLFESLNAGIAIGITETTSMNVFQYDVLDDVLTVVNMPDEGMSGFNYYDSMHNKDSRSAAMSCDGSFIVYYTRFHSSGTPVSEEGVYLADMRGSTITRTFISQYGGFPNMSCNGNYITYTTGSQSEITPIPSGGIGKVVEYNRLTGQKIYLDTDSNSPTTPTGTPINPEANALDMGTGNVGWTSLADSGDALVGKISGSTAYIYLRHVSDGSGTLEHVQKTPTGTAIPITTGALLVGWENTKPVRISANGKYVVYSSSQGTSLGLPQASGVVRSETGL